MSVSHWRMIRPGPRTRESAEAVVIGAGVVGLWTALELARHGVRAIVLDRHRAGAGASTRNAGFLMRGAAEHYGAAVEEWGRDTARELWRWSEENLAMLRDAGVEQLQTFANRASCVLGINAEEASELKPAAAMMREDGFDVQLLAPGEPGTDDAAWACGRPLAGLVNPADAVVNPAELIAWLESRLPEPVRPMREVVEIRSDGERSEVLTAEGVIETPRVFVCVNAWAGRVLPELEGVVVPQRGQMLALQAPGVRLDRAYYANRGSEYFRAAGDGTIVVGGCRTQNAALEVGFGDEPTTHVQADLEAFASRVLGEHGRVIRRWAGTMGFSSDGLPIVGAIRPGVWAAVGFTGHGMSLGVRSARAMVEGALGAVESRFSPQRLMHNP